jgi:predicted NBD/HSP70 family sugar kinase/transcriptional regulator with XRE-family HTH domain
MNDRAPRHTAASDRDDLDEMLEEIAADPDARAAYEDALLREELLESLVNARKRRSQKAVAAAMGTTQSAISDIENGRVDPRLSTLQRYARAVGKRLAVMLPEGNEVPGDIDNPEVLALAVEHSEEKHIEEILTELVRKGEKIGPQSFADLARVTGLPEPTVGHAVLRLFETGWVERVQAKSRESRFSLTDDRGLMIGISLSREHVDASLTSLTTRQVLAELERPLPDPTPPSVVEAVVGVVRELRDHAEAGQEIVGLGVVLAGRIHQPSGTVYFAPDLQTDKDPWKQVPLEAELEQATHGNAFGDAGKRVVVDNDANALAMHEYLLAGEDQSVVIVLMAESGEGIGSGLVVNGDIVRGVDGIGGEIGHIIVNPEGKPCRCGARGCLETIASAHAIVEAIRGRRETTEAPIQSLSDASALVHGSGSTAARAFARAGEELGRVLSSVTAVVGAPHLIIFGPPELTKESDFASAREFLDGTRRTHGHAILGVNQDVVAKVLEPSTLPRAAAAAAVHEFLSEPRQWVPTMARPTISDREWQSQVRRARFVGV